MATNPSGALPFYINPTAGVTSTTVCILFGFLAASCGATSIAFLYKDTIGDQEAIVSPAIGTTGTIPVKRSKNGNGESAEEKTERTPLASSVSGSVHGVNGSNNGEFGDNVHEFIAAVGTGSRVFVAAQFGVCTAMVFLVTVVACFSILSWASAGEWGSLLFIDCSIICVLVSLLRYDRLFANYPLLPPSSSLLTSCSLLLAPPHPAPPNSQSHPHTQPHTQPHTFCNLTHMLCKDPSLR